MARGLRILLRRDVAAWCLYDWANSAFITSVVVVLLQVGYDGYFADPDRVLIDLGFASWHTSADALWGYINSGAMVAVALAAPTLGAMADSIRGKKRFLAVAAIGGAICTAALAAPGAGGWVAVSTLYVGAFFLWSAANVFYDGLLPDLSEQPDEMDAISSAGYGLGYLGGGLMLLANVAVVSRPGWFGLHSPMAAMRTCFVAVGLWWAAFSLPLLLSVRERGPRFARPAGNVVALGLRRLVRTLRRVGRLPELTKFLLAFLLFDSGIGTVLLMAARFAGSSTDHGGLGLDTGEIIAALLMVQFVGLPASFGFIYLARRLGSRGAIVAGIVVYLAVVLYAFFIQTAGQFWTLALLVALVQGGTQAISRSLFGSLIPAGASAEFFGFFSVFNKVGSFLGPLAFALARDLTGSMRWAILGLSAFFVLGLLILLTVRVERGRQQARLFDSLLASPG